MFQAKVLNEILKMNKMSIGKRVKAQSLVSEIGLNILRRVQDLIWTPAHACSLKLKLTCSFLKSNLISEPTMNF